VSQYQKSKTNLDFTEARDSEWQWHQLGRMQVCTSLQTDNQASSLPLSFLQAECPSCHPTNSVSRHIFYPFAIETAGTWHEMAIELTQETGRRITTITEDIRETTFLFQCLSIALER